MLKGIAVLWMILVQVLRLFAGDQVINNSLTKGFFFLGGPFIAPVFICILGYFIAKSEKTPKQHIIRGIKIFCLGMGLNIALNLSLMVSVIRGIYQIDLLPYIFGVDVLQFSGISIVLIIILKKILESAFIFGIFISLFAAFLGQLLLFYIPENKILVYVSAFFYGSGQWSYFPIFPWIAYPLLGVVFYQIKNKFSFSFLNSLKIKLLIMFLFFVFFVLTIYYAFPIVLNFQLYYHHGIIFYFWTVLFLIGYCFFVNEINFFYCDSSFLKYLRWLGKYATTIYVIQCIIIGNLTTAIYKTINSPIYLIGCFLAVIIVSSSLVYGLVRINKKLKIKLFFLPN